MFILVLLNNENYYVTEEGILVHNGYKNSADAFENSDPPDTFRDANGKLRNADGTFAADPNTVHSDLRDNRPAYGKDQVDDVWAENALKDSNGDILKTRDGLEIGMDPNTGEVLTWDRSSSRSGQWDMGHKPGQEYRTLCDRYESGEITYDQFLNEYKNPKNYRPEAPSSNRSGKFEQK